MKKKTYLCLIASFILGGILGSILSINFGYVGFSFVIVIIITAILFSFHLQKKTITNMRLMSSNNSLNILKFNFSFK